MTNQCFFEAMSFCKLLIIRLPVFTCFYLQCIGDEGGWRGEAHVKGLEIVSDQMLHLRWSQT